MSTELKPTPKTDAMQERFNAEWKKRCYPEHEATQLACTHTDDAVAFARHLERTNAELVGLLTDIRTFIATVNQALMMIDGDNAQATAILDQIDKAIDKRALARIDAQAEEKGNG